jgi:hypothetical protein
MVPASTVSNWMVPALMVRGVLPLALAAPVEGLAKAIQLSVAPVFLLAGVSGLLGVFTNRLARIIERARVLQDQARSAPIARGREVRRELLVQKRRMTLVLRAIQCCTVTVLLVCLVVAVVFVSAVARLDLALLVVPLFVAAMAWLMAAVVLFLIEMQLAAEQLRRRF